MNTYCRIWEVGGQATLTTITEGGELKAKLEIQLGSPAAPRPGAPSATSGHPAAAHRSCHRGPAAKARSRARAAAYQVKKAAAATATASSTAAMAAGSGASPSSSAPQRRPLHLLPSPPAGRRRVMSVGRMDMPSFSPLNLDGTHPSPPPTSTVGSAFSALSPVPRDYQQPNQGDALFPPASVALTAALAPTLENASSPAPGCNPVLNDTPAPTPGDASRFLTARSLWQCDALAKGGKSCEKIFCCADDLSEHLLEVHKSRNWNAYCVVLYIDEHDFLYIL